MKLCQTCQTVERTLYLILPGSDVQVDPNTAISKACQQTCVNLIVTFKLDIDKQAAPLRKKFEKLQWQINNTGISEDQIRDKRQQIDQLKQQIQALEGQLTPLHVIKAMHKTHQWGKYLGGP